MASVITNPVTNANSDRSSRKKKKKKSSAAMSKENQQQSHAKWKSEAQQQTYSSKLIQALSQLSFNSNISSSTSSSPSSPRPGRAVREAADRALAVAAKGRTRWSRAILTRRVKLKFRKQKRNRGSAAATVAAAFSGSSGSRKPRFSVSKLRAKSLPTVQRKIKVLGRLVPGCRKEPLPVILEEATDYIAALEMQVRAMSAIADLLSGSGAAARSSSPPPPISQ
ncbi:bHLH148 protein [Hibiscus syriacus]|uniref:BHLH148 protein n=1 Tax=Hibiscus syriacus TaxID=106335 RepID=A0A6A3BK94_HIBSY|nr:transcription factor bHLH148-like [Hibiscus syriacus]KAE8717420.1 bHLH148 protein [Hibiscus syriacus]